MSARVLVLNADYSLLDVVPWEKAMSMWVRDKVSIVAEYTGRAIRSASASFTFPAVVVLKRFAKAGRRVKLNRRNLAARDAYTCMYCGLQPRKPSGAPDMSQLTLDHVKPRAQGGLTTWNNLLLACAPCNAKKADRTPEEAKMKPIQRPRRPGPLDLARMRIFNEAIPPEWELYIGHLLED